jgi:hypothetical protein
LASYIRTQIAAGELTEWTVAVLAGDAEPLTFAGITFHTLKRSPLDRGRAVGRYVVKTILAPRDEAIDLGPIEYGQAVELSNLKRADKGKDPDDTPRRPRDSAHPGSGPAARAFAALSVIASRCRVGFGRQRADLWCSRQLSGFGKRAGGALSVQHGRRAVRNGMTDLLAELRSKWSEALASGTAGREWRAIGLSKPSPVKLLAGIRDRDGRISILIEAALRYAPKHRVRFHSEGITLIDERSTDEGLLRLAVTLERPDLRDIFEILALDLLSVASGSPSADVAIQQAIRRLEAWQVCLRLRRRGLTREEQVGLLGEIAAINLLQAETGLALAIAAWCGPLNGIHDFQAAGVAVEVKATIGLSNQIRISHLDQLDYTGLGTLVLMRIRFQEAPEGLTLPELIAALRKKIEVNLPRAAAEFDDKLMRTGYLDADTEIYGSTRTVLNDLQGFRIREGFPRLVRTSVPAAIIDAAYSLDERQLTPFRIPREELSALIHQMRGSS